MTAPTNCSLYIAAVILNNDTMDSRYKEQVGTVCTIYVPVIRR